jgi:hypothetical protein
MPTMNTQINIVNSALLKLGATRISSITQNTKSAIHMNAIWAQILDCVLRAHPWHFAKKRVTLVPNATTPPYEYDFTYDLPGDWIRPLEPEHNDCDFVVESNQILTNWNPLNIAYIFRNTDPSTWDACFCEAMAWRLANEAAYDLTQNTAVVGWTAKGYLAQLAEARAMNGVENNNFPALEADTWTDARKGFRYGLLGPITR